MNTCPYCYSAVKQHKAGLNHSGSQRYECGGVDGSTRLCHTGRAIRLRCDATRCIVGWNVITERTTAALQAILDGSLPAQHYFSDQLPTDDTLVYYPADYLSLPNKSQTACPPSRFRSSLIFATPENLTHKSQQALNNRGVYSFWDEDPISSCNIRRATLKMYVNRAVRRQTVVIVLLYLAPRSVIYEILAAIRWPIQRLSRPKYESLLLSQT